MDTNTRFLKESNSPAARKFSRRHLDNTAPATPHREHRRDNSSGSVKQIHPEEKLNILNVVSKDTVNEFVWGNVDLNSEHEPDHKPENGGTDEEHLQLAGLKKKKKFECTLAYFYWSARQLIHPHSKPKFWWDLAIIFFSLLNAIFVPYELAFQQQSRFIIVIDPIMDACFIIDIFVNFRSIYFDSRTNEPVKDAKQIAINYVFKGRFFVDLLASFPVDLLILMFKGVDPTTLKLLAMLKLTRLLRLARIITFIRFKKEFKVILKMVLLFLYLFLILHFLSCASFYVFDVANTWIPPKDLDNSDNNPSIITLNNPADKYILMFYYATLFLLQSDPLPTNLGELWGCFFFTFLGSITFGILIG